MSFSKEFDLSTKILIEKSRQFDKYYNLVKERDEQIKNLKKEVNNLRSSLKKFEFLSSASKKYSEMNEQEKILCSNNLDYYFRNLSQQMYEQLGLELGEIKMYVSQENQINVVDLRIIDFRAHQLQYTENVYKALYIKDYLRLSNFAYTYLARELDCKIASIYHLEKTKEELHKKFGIIEIEDGCYLNPKTTITKKLIQLYETNNSIYSNDSIRIKLSADGTELCRNVNVINIVFSVIDEGVKAATASGSYLLAILPYNKECYEEISPCMTALWDLLDDFKEINIGGRSFGIDLYFGADYKMDLLVAGLKGANSLEPCLQCDAKKGKLHLRGRKRQILIEKSLISFKSNDWIQFKKKSKIDLDKCQTTLCEIYDDEFENLAIYEDVSKIDLEYSIFYERMLVKLPVFKFIIDLLHMFLRVSDKLFENLMDKLIKIDKFDLFYDPKKHKNIRKIVDFIKECKINVKNQRFDEESLSKTFTSLQGPQRIKFFEKVTKTDDFKDLLASIKEIKNSEDIFTLWKDFYIILKEFRSNVGLNHNDMRQRIEKWFLHYLNTENQTSVTPYIHMFAHHLLEQHQYVTNINFFSTQGIEKLNDMSTMDFFKATNKRSYSLQMMQRSLRLDFLKPLIRFNEKRKYERRSGLNDTEDRILLISQIIGEEEEEAGQEEAGQEEAEQEENDHLFENKNNDESPQPLISGNNKRKFVEKVTNFLKRKK